MISVEAAQQRILSPVTPLAAETVSLNQAVGRVLAQAIVATMDLPPFDNAAMDGYAVRAQDTEDATPIDPVRLVVSGLSTAGHPAVARVEPGHAHKIMTGAPLPIGADAVVPVEEVTSEGAMVFLQQPQPANRYIRPKGQDTQRGERLLTPGITLHAAQIGLLASQGLSAVSVYRRPRVGIIATGDELVEPGQPLAPGQIPNSNSYALMAAVTEAGGIAVVYPPAADDLKSLTAIANQAVDEVDVIISSGGVSVGEYDFVKTVLQDLGHLDFWRVDMKPGKPVAFGAVRDIPWLGLPGNPVSSLVTFELFARPLIRALQHDEDWQRLVTALPLGIDFDEVSDRRHYVRVALIPSADGHLEAWPTGAQDSHLQTSWTNARGLMVIPPNQGPLARGSWWPVMLL
jgi:molybdopterin molybdotransferase